MNIISKSNALYEYKDFNIVPYYLYYGVRGSEIRLFENMGYANKKALMTYIGEILLNPNRLVNPNTDKNGNRLWRVTTSDDMSNSLYKEGSVYVLKEPKRVKNKTFVGWFNTIDEKYYKPGDKYTVIHGTHFIAVWK